jgi:hypothetical protein
VSQRLLRQDVRSACRSSAFIDGCPSLPREFGRSLKRGSSRSRAAFSLGVAVSERSNLLDGTWGWPKSENSEDGSFGG